VPLDVTMLDVLIASPGDAVAGRDAVERALHAWNDSRGDDTGFILRPRRWEIAAVAVVGQGDAQTVINQQLVDESDIVFGLFYNRLGTPSGRAASGTAEEVERSVAAGKQVHLYFADMLRPHQLDTKQLDALEAFKALVESKGLVAEFKSEGELEAMVGRAIERDIKLIRRNNPKPGPATTPEPAASSHSGKPPEDSESVIDIDGVTSVERSVPNDSFTDAIDEDIKSPPYARALSAIAGLLLVLAGASFAWAGRTLTRLVPSGPGFFGTQIADFAAVAGLVVLGAGLLVTRSRWNNAGWLATAGLFIGLLPFLSLRIWRSAELRGGGLLALEGPLLLIFLALGLISILLARNPEVAVARPRVSDDSTLTAIVFGVVALIGLAAIGVVLPYPNADLATHKFSDPMLLIFAVPLAIIAAFTHGFLRAAVLAGWTGGTAGVLVITIWLRMHPGVRIPGIILNAHLLLSIFTVAILATISVLALRKS
jgi:hypothetical protein